MEESYKLPRLYMEKKISNEFTKKFCEWRTRKIEIAKLFTLVKFYPFIISITIDLAFI